MKKTCVAIIKHLSTEKLVPAHEKCLEVKIV